MKVDLSGLQSKKLHKALADPRFVPTVEDEMSICWFVENIVQSLSRNLTFGLRPSKSPTDFPMNCCFLWRRLSVFTDWPICGGTSMTTKYSSYKAC